MTAPERNQSFDRLPAYLELLGRQKIAEQLGIELPFFRVHDGVARSTCVIEGKTYVNFATYNYLDLCGHPEVSAAAKAAIDQFGTSASASRLVSGERPLHRELEQSLADLIGVDDCLTFVSGHATNVTTIGHLMGPRDLIIHDALAHNSIVQGAVLSRAQRTTFRHNDVQDLDRLLREVRPRYEQALVVTEGHFSMDGDIPPLAELVEVKNRHGAWLMVDEAHAMGVLGPTGRGIAEHARVNPRSVDIWMGTLSKTLAGCGGFIAGPKALVEYLRFTAPGFVYSVGLPPPIAAASLASLRVLLREPERVRTLSLRASLFLDLCRRAGLDTGLSMGFAIIPVITGSSQSALMLAKHLFDAGINVQPIGAPAVPERAARLRFFVTSGHTKGQITNTVEAIAARIRRA